MAPDNNIKYDAVTVHFTDESPPVVVERVLELAKSCFPSSGDPALQIIDIPTIPTGGGLFDMKLNLFRPSEVDYLLLEDGEEKTTAEIDEIFEEWEW